METSATRDKKVRNKKSFNAVDLLVLVIVLGVLAAAAFAYVPGLLSGNNKSGSYVEITYIIRNAESGIATGIALGENVLCEGLEVGKVKSVSVSDSLNGKYDVEFVIEASAKEYEDHYEICGIVFASGIEYNLEFGKFVSKAVCVKLAVGGAS